MLYLCLLSRGGGDVAGATPGDGAGGVGDGGGDVSPAVGEFLLQQFCDEGGDGAAAAFAELLYGVDHVAFKGVDAAAFAGG